MQRSSSSSVYCQYKETQGLLYIRILISILFLLASRVASVASFVPLVPLTPLRSDFAGYSVRSCAQDFISFHYLRRELTAPTIAAAGSVTRLTMSSFIPLSDQRRTARLLKYMTPARVLYLLNTRANFWPYGPSSHHRPRVAGVSGLCSIKPKIKEYAEKTEIQWLVNADFLRKMKRVNLYFTS